MTTKRVFAVCHTLCHCVYFGLVFLEAHGTYGIAAGVLFLVSAVGLILHMD